MNSLSLLPTIPEGQASIPFEFYISSVVVSFCCNKMNVKVVTVLLVVFGVALLLAQDGDCFTAGAGNVIKRFQAENVCIS